MEKEEWSDESTSDKEEYQEEDDDVNPEDEAFLQGYDEADVLDEPEVDDEDE